ncbi:MAG: hypothetical protein GQ574_00220 [Crocinitomix sp.]|nr:hypothetical protein [Crocinitomix sp.]
MKHIKLKFVLILFFIHLIGEGTHAQSLDSLLQLAVSQNTSLKSLELEYKAALAKADQVSQIPNPKLGIGIPILQAETRLGPQLMMVSASQLFPWFGTLKAKKEVIVSMSKMRYEKMAALKLNLFYAVKSNYYELLFINEQQALIEKDILLLKTLEQLSLSKVASAQSSIADVLRIQLKIEELNSKIALLENAKYSSSARINEITKQAFSEQINVNDILLQLPLFKYDLEAFQQKIAAHHPLMEMLNAEIETSENRTIVNSATNKPTIGLGIDYSLVGERTDANPINNGRDILIPKVMLSIPIYRKSFNAINEIEALNREALEWDKISLADQMTRQLIELKAEYDNALLIFQLSEKQEVTAKQTYEILLNNYSTNSAGFDDLLSIQSQLLKYKQQNIKARLQANIAVAKIERLTNF